MPDSWKFLCCILLHPPGHCTGEDGDDDDDGDDIDDGEDDDDGEDGDDGEDHLGTFIG